MHIKRKQKWLHPHPPTLWTKFTQMAFFSQFKKNKTKYSSLNWWSLKNTADGHDGSNAAAACFITCVDLKDVANHSLDKWTRFDFPMLLFSTPPTVNENLFAGHWWVVGRHTYLCLAKEEKKKKKWNMQIVENLLCWISKLVRILNGVCCAIVHLHCSCQNQLLLKNLMSAKTRLACCFYFYFFSIGIVHISAWCFKAISGTAKQLKGERGSLWEDYQRRSTEQTHRLQPVNHIAHMSIVVMSYTSVFGNICRLWALHLFKVSFSSCHFWK